jgi:hypothetical protein
MELSRYSTDHYSVKFDSELSFLARTEGRNSGNRCIKKFETTNGRQKRLESEAALLKLLALLSNELRRERFVKFEFYDRGKSPEDLI